MQAFYKFLTPLTALSLILGVAGCAGLTSNSRSDSAAAAESASKILPVLVQSLQHESADTRLRSVQALEAMGKSAAPAANDLIFLLDDPDTKVREAAAATLVHIGPSAVGALQAAVQDRRYPSVRREVFPVLAKIGPQAKAALPALQAAAAEEDAEIAALANAAANVISGSSGAGGSYEARRDEPQAGAPAPAPQAIEPTPPPPVLVPKISAPLSIHALVQELKNPDGDYRRQAVEALAFTPQEAGEVLPVLVHIALNDQDPAVRFAASSRLKSLGTPPASALILALNHTQADVRRHAVNALGVIGPVTPSIIPALIDSLRDEKTAAHAVAALSEMGLKSVESLIKALQDDAIEAAAGEALVRIGRPAAGALAAALEDEAIRARVHRVLVSIGKPAVAALISSFAKYDFEARAAALVAIGRPAVGMLVKALRTREDKVRQGSGFTLCQIGPAAADAVPAFIEVLKAHPDEMELYPIWRFGAEGAPALLRAAADEDSDIRLFALQVLARLNPLPQEAIPGFIVGLHDKDSRIGDLSTLVIKDQRDRAIGALVSALASADKSIARPAAEALGFIGSPAKKAVDELRYALLRHADPGVRKRAAYALGEQGSAAKNAARDLIASLEDEAVRWWAAAALRKIGSSAVPALSKTVRDDDSPVRFRAALLLNQLDPGNDHAQRLLLGGLGAQDSAIRYRSALALGANPGLASQSVAPLMISLKDGDPSVRFAAAHALGNIGEPAVGPLLLAASAEKSALSTGAMSALLQLSASAAPALVSGLSEKATRDVASDILLKMGPKGIPALVDVLTARGPQSPAGAILLRLGDAAVPALIQTSKDGRDGQKRGAVLVLKKIGTPLAIAAVKE